MRGCCGIALASIGIFASGAAPAQTFPAKPVRIIVAFPAGGGTDITARVIGPKLAEIWGHQVLVDNRPGASGTIGTEQAARAAPDGHTLFMGTMGNLSVNKHLFPKLSLDPARDFVPVTQVVAVQFVMVAHPSLPANNLKELIALAKARPGKLNFAIGALGSSLHMAGDLFKMMSGAYIVNIPYRGTAPAIQDVLAGQVEMMFANIGNAQAHLRAGKLKALGVTSPKRLAAFPDVPAIAEVLPGYESSAWFGLFGPGRMAPDLARRVGDAARQAIATPEVQRRIQAEGATPVGNTPDEFARFVHVEIERWAKVVKYSGAKPE